jgi:hypothetical protein
MPLKSHEFDRLANKLELKTRNSGDLLAWFEYEGKIITRTKRSKGKTDLPMSDRIRQQLKLNEEQLRGIVSCTISREGYIEILKKKNLI